MSGGRWMAAPGGFVNLDHATAVIVVTIEVPDGDEPKWAVILHLVDSQQVGLGVFTDPEAAQRYAAQLALTAQRGDAGE